MTRDRYLHKSIVEDLPSHMVFIGGPRQVGKTTLAQYIGQSDYRQYAYLNWDNRLDRKNILSEVYDPRANLVIYDELHKYKRWKSYLKGEFDKYRNKFSILVTGSARLDLYRRGGDSLMGRYHYYRLHPFSLAEAVEILPSVEAGKELVFVDNQVSRSKILKDLLKFGGFPEPFLARNLKTLRRFHNERLERLVKEDIRDLESVRDLSALQILVDLLPSKVGSLFSLNSMREDLQVTHKTISHWVDILERLYYHFRIYPFATKLIKSLRKEPKLYLWDWSQVEDPAARLENMVASHLLKFVHFLYDTQGYKTELFFLREIGGREIDFLVTYNRRPWFVVEVKSSSTKVSKQLKYYTTREKIPYAYQLVVDSGVDFLQDRIRIISADKFLCALV